MNRRAILKSMLAVVGATSGCSLFRALESEENLFDSPANSKLSHHYRAMLPPLTELIIPKTETPGAIEAGVPEFIDHMYSDWCTANERKILLGGLEELNLFCQEAFAAKFLDCESAERILALRNAEKEAKAYAPPGGSVFFTGYGVEEEAPFFHKLRQLTVFGYYMSEVGATQELKYVPLPGHYESDYEFENVGRQWSS